MKHNFKKLEIWNRSRVLVKDIYELSREFPNHELYGLSSQISRAAVSVPSNIAEGVSRSTDSQIAHFLDISIASICELETQVLLAFDLHYLKESDSIRLSNEISQIRRMLIQFQKLHR